MIKDLQNAFLSYDKVRPQIEAQDPSNLSAHNVDIADAASIAMGAEAVIVTFRDDLVKLPNTHASNIDNLRHYALAAWYLQATNLPTPDPAEASDAIEEVAKLREKYLMWAVPLAFSGIFSEDAISQIRERTGAKDRASDLVALAHLFDENWPKIEKMCGITRQDIQRASELGAAVFAMLSRRDNPLLTQVPQQSLRVKQAWTLLDRAYDECRRGLTYLRWHHGDVDLIAPNLRRNPGRPRKEKQEETNETVPIRPLPVLPIQPSSGTPLGGDESPFTK